jgi:hypothetical protein
MTREARTHVRASRVEQRRHARVEIEVVAHFLGGEVAEVERCQLVWVEQQVVELLEGGCGSASL